MNTRFPLHLNALSVALVGFACGAFGAGCGNKSSGGSNAGTSATGASSGTSSSGGATSTNGGASSSGATSGGKSSGGASSGGASSGGVSSGGASSGGTQAGGAGNTAAGGSSGASQGGASTSGGANTSGTNAGGTGGSSSVLKIIAVGDSITRATCWRAKLWQELNQNHAGAFNFVGTLSSDNGCTPTNYDKDNQGYSSSLLTEVVAGITNARTCDPLCPTLNDFATAFNTTLPDVALIHYGTNDVWNAKPAASIIDGYSQLIDKLRAANPNVKVLLAQIIPMNVTSTTCSGCTCAGCPTAIPALNTQIASWAPTKSTAASPITVVDQYTGFDAVADTRDGVHPNDSGSQKMADKWAAALNPLF